eukprot:scaffold306497_cov182-Cyclotella_meneghiniana.AAC.1
MATDASDESVGNTSATKDGIKPSDDETALSESDNQTHDGTGKNKKRSGNPLQNGPATKASKSDSIMNEKDKDGSTKQNYNPVSKFIDMMVRDKDGKLVPLQEAEELPVPTAALVECEENETKK